MPLSKAPFVLAAGIVLALPALGAVKTVTIDRRLPVNQYCPIDNVDFDLTFVADGPFARVSFFVMNESPGGTFLANKLDNFAVIAKSAYDAHHVAPLNFSACYAAPGDPNAPALDFTAAGTNEARLDLFDTTANGWDLNSFASFHGGGGAPRNPVNGSDVSGGCLQLGNLSSGAVKVSTNVLVSGLTAGTEYVVTGWWSTADTSRPLTVQIDSEPCVDRDGDGVLGCVDCDDENPHRKPGAVEACDGVDNNCDGIIDESTPCAVECDVPQRFTADGRITNSSVASIHPSATWDGNEFGLFFEDSVGGSPDVFFARASTSGVEIGSENGIAVSTLTDRFPRAVWTGSEYGVAWIRNGQAVFQRYSRAGTAVGAMVTLGSATAVDVAWTGAELGIVWTLSNHVYVQRLSPDAAPLMALPLQYDAVGTPFRETSNPRIAWNGSAYGVLWVERDFTIRFRVVPPLAVGSGTPVTLVTAGVNSTGPSIAAGGSTWGVTWYDDRDGPDPEIYFAHVGSNGAKLGADVRVTNAAGQSFAPSIAWSGAEWGIAWDDLRTGDEEIWFARVSAEGVKQGTDFRVTDSTGESREPSIVWAGGRFGVAWTDFRDGANGEIYFAPIGCDCIDADTDGFSSCVDCDDGDATVYPGAPQACTGVTNNCDNPHWPDPLGASDEDGDGFAPCQGDCDDAHASVYAGAPQICDGLNNNCNWALWPELTGTNDGDDDGDGFSECAGDCSDAAPNSWATPGEARSLSVTHNQGTGVTSLLWLAPTFLGGTAPFYDTIRSPNAADFVSAAACVETNGGGNTVSSDATAPSLGSVFYYLIRAENSCPGGIGIGPIGTDSQGVPRTARTCP